MFENDEVHFVCGAIHCGILASGLPICAPKHYFQESCSSNQTEKTFHGLASYKIPERARLRRSTCHSYKQPTQTYSATHAVR